VVVRVRRAVGLRRRVLLQKLEADLDGLFELGVVPGAPCRWVELDPAAWRAGRDAQLEKAVEVCLELLKKSPPPKPNRPAYPNYHRGAGK